MLCRIPEGQIPPTHCCEKPQNLHELFVRSDWSAFCFDYEFSDVLRLSMFADIFITSAGCLAVNSVSVAKQERELYERPIAT
jgi:membrane-bound metal-dependent hydrolase YbcI (DUF457 family)